MMTSFNEGDFKSTKGLHMRKEVSQIRKSFTKSPYKYKKS